MGIISDGKALWKALFTRTQRRVLGLLYGYPDRSFHTNEIVRRAGVGTGSVQRELARLAAAGVVTVTRVGNQKRYRANPDCPLFGELCAMVLKTLGAVDHLRRALASLGGDIELAFLYTPPDADPADASLGLLVVSGTTERDAIVETIEAAGRRIGRSIRLTVIGPVEFRARRKRGDAMLAEALRHPRVLLAGEWRDG